MYKKTSKKLEKLILEKISAKAFLRRTSLQKEEALMLVKPHIKPAALTGFLSAADYRAGSVLEFCRPLLGEICEEEPAEGWLSFIYRASVDALYTETPADAAAPEERARLFYLEILAAVLEIAVQQHAIPEGYYFEFLTEEELSRCGDAARYREFLSDFKQDKIYEIMWIGGDVTKFDFLGHVAGVHRVAMHAARQLSRLDVPVDLSIISGAAAGHDIGKYGCKGEETARIPYLHYYYTDRWFKKHGIPSIGHIAANHSTWDLELENLSVESLLLIYADFRVKSDGYDESGRERIRYYTIREAFDVILSKLDNVDEAKEKRYRKVYGKLKDFEDYMVSLGVKTDLNAQGPGMPEKRDPSVLTSESTVQLLKYMAIEHNIRVMSVFESDAAFATMQEAARSEKDWRNRRAYLNVFEEYFTYMTLRQKELTLRFLYEQFFQKEGDIRRQAAVLMGKILVNFDVKYRKELPKGAAPDSEEMTGVSLWEKYLEKMFRPSHKIIEQQRRWVGFAFKRVVETICRDCKRPDERERYLKSLLAYYAADNYDEVTAFALLDTMRSLPFCEMAEEDRGKVIEFACGRSGSDSSEIRAAVLAALSYFADQGVSGFSQTEKARIAAVAERMQDEKEEALRYLSVKLLRALGGQAAYLPPKTETISEIFLKNMKIATPWIIKEIHIGLLTEYLRRDERANRVQVATHFSNLLKGSERITVRHTAGAALLETAPLLTREQRNELAIELTKGLETGEYEFSKYIPDYLGRLVLFLYPSELDEFLLELKKFLDSTSERVACVSLNTLGVMLRYYCGYRARFAAEETEEAYEKRRRVMIGLLLGGMANYNPSVNQEAFMVLGCGVFADREMSEAEKLCLFRLTYRKITTILPSQEKDELAFLNNAAALNHIYRFISDYLFAHERFEIEEPSRVVFFPGTFDPFSLSHKKIATMLRDLGFAVYLAIDEFSWSKKTQPHMIRKRIMAMSVAAEENIFLFPDDIPVNIASPLDLKRLREVFSGRELYLAVGADVVRNASSYRAEPSPYSVHSMNHVIFKRFGVEMEYGKFLSGKVVEMELPEELTDVSSTRIRDYIDQNRDISGLVETVVQNYIYENRLYLREPEFKPIIGGETVDMEIYDVCSAEQIGTIRSELSAKYGKDDHLIDCMEGSGAVFMLDRKKENSLLGAVVFRSISTAELYGEFQSTEVANYIREKSAGSILLLQGIYTFGRSEIREREQLMLTEALAHALEKDYTYCIYSPQTEYARPKKEDFLLRQGFMPLQNGDSPRKIFVVDMKQPIALFKNIITALKAPFNEAPRVVEAIDKAHSRLQLAVTKLYPGHLVLSFDSSVMYNRMLNIITAVNHVPPRPLPVRQLGESMCVPFGKILRGVAVPNTVTKTLHTEKVFAPDVRAYEIREYPEYLSLEDQVRTIKSFRRNVILVDDILNKGYRMKKLNPIFEAENVSVDRLVVGLASGRGKDLMEIQKRKLEYVYYLPNLKAWFVESTIYPFIGGDMVDRQEKVGANLLSSVNLILPYAHPSFVGDASKAALYDLSMVCLENARDLLRTLENEYQERFGKKLTLGRLSEAVISPCCPDRGECFECDYHLAPSSYVQDDIERLKRLEKLMKE